MDNLNDNIPQITFKDEKSQPVSGAICIRSDHDVRVAFIEEKLDSDEFGNIEVVRECRTQIVMSPQVARNIVDVIEQNLNSVE